MDIAETDNHTEQQTGTERYNPVDVDEQAQKLLTYYAGLWHSARKSAGVPPDRLGFSNICLIT